MKLEPVALQRKLTHAQGGGEEERLHRAVVKADGDPVPLPGGEQAGAIAGVAHPGAGDVVLGGGGQLGGQDRRIGTFTDRSLSFWGFFLRKDRGSGKKADRRTGRSLYLRRVH